MLHHFQEPKHCVYLRQSLTDSRKMIDIGYLGEALPSPRDHCKFTAPLPCHVGLQHNLRILFKSKILEKMPTSTAEFYCRQQTVDRVVEAGTNIMNVMYAKLGKLTDTTLLTLDKLRHKLFLSSLRQKKGLVHKKGCFKICRIQGDLLVCEGLNFPGGFDFEEGKALFWHWIIPIFKKNPPSDYYSIFINQYIINTVI